VSREEDLYLKDILHACDKVLRYSRGLSRDQVFEDEKTYDAILRNLEIIGEAVKRLSPGFRQRHSQIEWRKIAGLRDIVIHEYFGLDIQILWDVISNKIPEFRAQIHEVAQLPNE